MSSDGEPDAAQLGQIEADLAQLTTHVDTWLQDRFLASESAAGLNLEDVSGLILWLRQWQAHFDAYGDGATTAVADRLAEIRTQIEVSIANFAAMATTLPQDQVQGQPQDREG